MLDARCAALDWTLRNPRGTHFDDSPGGEATYGIGPSGVVRTPRSGYFGDGFSPWLVGLVGRLGGEER